MLGTGSLRKKNRTELKSATVAINENVVQAVLQFLSAETLYKNLWVPIRINAMIACVYQLSITDWFQVQSSGFRGCNIPTLLMFQYSVRTNLFHPLGVKALQVLWIRNPLRIYLLGFFDREPGTLNPEPPNLE